MKVKDEIRILGWNEGSFDLHATTEVPTVGVVTRGSSTIDGVIVTKLQVDGMEGTLKLAKALNSSSHKEQVRVIVLHGISYAGMNIIDIQRLSDLTDIPVIAVNKKRPDLSSFQHAISNFSNFQPRLEAVESAGSIYKLTRGNYSTLYFQYTGITLQDARTVLTKASHLSTIPESLRVAGLIASAIS